MSADQRIPFLNVVKRSPHGINLDPASSDVADLFPEGAAEEGMCFETFQRKFVLKSDAHLGEGTFGNVFMCVEREWDVAFALKVFKETLTDKELDIHIMKEKEVLCDLNVPGHDNIIKLFATTKSPASQYNFIYELATNKDLNYWMHKRFWGVDALHIDCVRFIAGEIVLALEYLRSKYYVHRDIKAKNILLDSNFHVKLAGFGFAKKINESRQAQNIKFLRQKNKKLEESITNAPEVTFKDEVTYSTDLWSLGCLIFDMYVGAPLGQENIFGWEQRYELIEKGSYQWGNDSPRPDVVNLVRQLTRRRGKDRIGAHDLQALKVHPFFAEIGFPSVPGLSPPPLAPSDEYPERKFVIPEHLFHPSAYVIPGSEPAGGPARPL